MPGLLKDVTKGKKDYNPAVGQKNKWKPNNSFEQGKFFKKVQILEQHLVSTGSFFYCSKALFYAIIVFQKK